MKTVFRCVVCDSSNIVKVLGQFLPYLAHKYFDYPAEIGFNGLPMYPPLPTNSIKCRSCGFLFSQLRPDEDEMQRYYADYGMASYQNLRAKFESWYIPNYHTEDDPSFLAHISAKEAELMRFMNGMVDFSSIGSVLDFGGGRAFHSGGAQQRAALCLRLGGDRAFAGDRVD